MSGSWVRGPVCGVDNCRSRNYRTLDGQRICQYGHVNESHIEFDDEQDEYVVTTKTIRIPGSKAGMSQASQITPSLNKDESRRRVFGVEGQHLHLRCFQIVLRKQVRSLIEDHGLPESLETIVKSLWIDYLNFHIFKRPNSNSTTDDSPPDDDDYEFKRNLSFLDSLALCYLACMYLKLPVYLNDFVTWTTTNKIPYMKASFDIPPSLRSRLAVIYLRKFEPPRPPLKSDLAIKVTLLADDLKLKDLTLNYRPLLFKLVKELILPPEVYFAAINFINTQKINFGFIANKQKAAMSTFPEYKLVCITIIIVKLYFIMPQIDPQYKVYSWEDWLNILEHLNLDPKYKGNFTNVLSSILTEENSINDVLDWDENKTEKYLDWYSTKILQKEDKVPIPIKRLYNIFKIEDNVKDDEVEITKEPHFDAFEKLLCSSRITRKPISDEDLLKIEDILIANLHANFGLAPQQLRYILRRCEKLFL